METTMNDRRAAWARIALTTFAHLTGLDESDGPETMLADLLADLRHMAHIDSIDYQEADERAAIRAYNEILDPDPDFDAPMPTLAAGEEHLIVVEINSAGRVAQVCSSCEATVAIVFTGGEDDDHRTYPATLLDEMGISALDAIVEWPIIHAKLSEAVRAQYPLSGEEGR